MMKIKKTMPGMAFLDNYKGSIPHQRNTKKMPDHFWRLGWRTATVC